MRKLGRLLWILWLLLAVANLLLINVYINHLGSGHELGIYQQLGYLGLSALFMLLCGVWWIAGGSSSRNKFGVVIGSIFTAVFGIAIVGGVIYAVAFDGHYIGVIVSKLSSWFSAISF